MRNIAFFGGTSHPSLAQAVAECLGIQAGRCELSKFSNGETSVQILESVRDLDVYLFQSACGRVNDVLMELLVMVAACRMASARKVVVVLPCFPYARQPDQPYKRNGQPRRAPLNHNAHVNDNVDMNYVQHAVNNVLSLRDHTASSEDYPHDSKLQVATSSAHPHKSSLGLAKDGYRHWVARSGTLVANMLVAAGASHVITMDLHDPQFQGFFDIPIDNLFASPLIIRYIQENIPNYKKAVIVSPDAGGAKRASIIATKLGMDFALIHKERKHSAANGSQFDQKEPLPIADIGPSISATSLDLSDYSMMLIGNVKDRECILVDDIADTSGTLTRAAATLTANGASKVYAIVTHGVLSGNAVETIEQSDIDTLIVSNTVPQEEHVKKSTKIKTFDVAPLLAEAIRRVHNGESVSYLLDPPMI